MATKPLWLSTTTLTGEITKSTSVKTCTKKQVQETLDEFCFSGFVYLTSAFMWLKRWLFDLDNSNFLQSILM